MGSSASVPKTERLDTETSDKSSPDPEPEPSVRSRGGSAGKRNVAKVTPLNAKENPTQEHETTSTTDAKRKLQNIEQEMVELETQNLRLQDQVSSLEQQVEMLERLNAENSAAEHNNNKDRTDAAADRNQNTRKLETEVETLQTELNKLRRKFKRKVRVLNNQLSESKQHHSVLSFEHQQEIKRLTEENTNLKDQIQHQPSGSDRAADTEEPSPDGRTQIIVQLSAKVSEQDSRILELEQELRDKETRITSLECDMDSPSRGPTGVRNQSSTGRRLQNSSPSRLQNSSPSRLGQSGRSDHRGSSGVSRDSGIVTLQKPAAAVAASPPGSDWGDSDDSDAAKPPSALSRVSGDVTASSSSSELDPGSIRRISAGKMRRQKTGKSDTQLPSPGNRRHHNGLLRDTDSPKSRGSPALASLPPISRTVDFL